MIRAGLGTALLVVSIGLFARSMHLDRTGVRVPAYVVGHHIQRGNSGRSSPVVHLEYRDEQGRSRILVHPDLPGIPPPTYVIYRPGEPDDPYVDGTHLLYLPAFLCMCASLLLFVWAWWPPENGPDPDTGSGRNDDQG